MTSKTTSVLMVLTSHELLGDTGQPTGWFVAEAAHPWKVFTDAGCLVEFASPLGGHPAMYGLDSEDSVQEDFLDFYGPRGPETIAVARVDPSTFAAVFFVGGHGTMWDFADDVALAALTSTMYEAGGVVAAVCHGPAALVNVRLEDGSFLVEGKRIAAFTDAEEAAVQLEEVVPFSLESVLKERGACHEASPNFEQKIVTDGRLVTGQNPASAQGVSEAVVGLLNSGSVRR